MVISFKKLIVAIFIRVVDKSDPPLGASLFQNILSIGASAASMKREPGSNLGIYSPAAKIV